LKFLQVAMLDQSCYTLGMDERKKKKRPADTNLLASQIVAEATEEPTQEEQPPQPERNPAAVALGRLGGLKGGPARAKKLSQKERIEIARIAARARWKKPDH
jgi:hypothetical protein